MTACADRRVLFRAAAGPRRGFGHLVRCRALARALGVRPLVSVRGGALSVSTALGLGCDVVPGDDPSVMAALRPEVVVVDDPSTVEGRRWIQAARQVGALTVSLHDLGLGCREADLVVDGSVTRAATARRGLALRGPRYAVLDAGCAVPPPHRPARGRRVLVALGGGPRVALCRAVARAVTAAVGDARVRIAGGFAAARAGSEAPRVVWTGPLDGLTHELGACDVAVVGGGVSLYEACARGAAAVAVSVVAAQQPTVMGFASRQAARGIARGASAPAAAAAAVAGLLAVPAARRHQAARGRAIVDGRGADRVARAIARLVAGRRPTARLREAA